MVDLTKLTDDQLDLLDAYHKKGMGGLSDSELGQLNKIINPSRWQGLWDATKGVGKAVGVGLAQVPGALADTFNPTTQIGKEPDIQKEKITSPEQLTEKFQNQPKEDNSFAGATQKAIGWEPQTGLEDYIARGTTGAAATALTGPASLARILALGVAPQVAAKYTGDVAASMGASPNTQRLASFGAGLFSPYIANRAVTPRPVADIQRRAATRTLNQAGVNTSAGQDVNSPTLMAKEGGAYPDRNEQQSRQFTRAITQHLGQPTEAVTIGQGEYLPTVGRSIGRNMDNVSSRNSIDLGVMAPHERLDLRSGLEQLARDNPQHVDTILKTIEDNTGWKPNMVGAPVASNPRQAAAERIWRTIYPGARVVSGENYQRLRSQMFSKAANLASSDPVLAEMYRDTARNLDQGMRYSIARQNPADTGAFENARQLLENNMVVSRARNKTKGSDQIPPNTLERAARDVVGDKRYNAGDTPFQSLATAAQKAMPALPDKESSVSQLTHTGLGAAALGALAGAGTAGYSLMKGLPYTQALESGLFPLFESTAAGAVPAWLAQKLATTRPGQAYLRNQALPAVPQNAAARRRNAFIQALMAGQR